MAPIYLKMGKSTVLRFTDKPIKVVIGNQNYYGLEFIEKDVAIQPHGAVATNLFVYTENHTYGFLLTPGERYDDMVFVKWSYGGGIALNRQPPAQSKSTRLRTTFPLGTDLKVRLLKLEGPSTFGLHILDCEIENVGKAEVDISNLRLHVSRGGKDLENQSVVIAKNKLKPHERTRARIIFKLDSKNDFSVEAKLKLVSVKTTIPRKLL